MSEYDPNIYEKEQEQTVITVLRAIPTTRLGTQGSLGLSWQVYVAG